MVEPSTRGDPQAALLWTAKSLRKLAGGLRDLGDQISHSVVGELPRSLGYSLQANRKTREGGNHPDRDAQFTYINEQVTAALPAGEPAISVDTKKKELVGDFKNAGREALPADMGGCPAAKVYAHLRSIVATGRIPGRSALAVIRDALAE